MSKKFLKKLEMYEDEAYKGSYGDAWLEEIGEGIKFYIEECVNSHKRATIAGLEKYIDNLYYRDKNNN